MCGGVELTRACGWVRLWQLILSSGGPAVDGEFVKSRMKGLSLFVEVGVADNDGPCSSSCIGVE